MWTSPAIAGFLQCNDRKLEKAEDVFLSFIVCLNINTSSLVHELLSNNSLFVGQL